MDYYIEMIFRIKYENIVCIVLLGTICNITLAKDTIPAFPGAEGFGKFASGGRGGKVIEVTTLDDMDRYGNYIEGSLRAALSTEGDYPITIVFRVSGTIVLKSKIDISRSNVTIAGQTAPGDGICIREHSVFLNGENMIIRYIRFRPGVAKNTDSSCLNIENSKNIIIDHCSFSWAGEENMGFYDNDSTTIQWSILSESLYDAGHPKGIRGYASQWGGQWASYHHNLLAHHNSRTPRFNGSHSNDYFAVQDFRNNVVYNYGGGGSIYGGENEVFADTNNDGINDAGSRINFVANYLKPGPAYSGSYFMEPSLAREDVTPQGYAQWYIADNIIKGYAGVTSNNWAGVDVTTVGSAENIRVDTAHEVEPVTTYRADSAYKLVLAYAGAIKPIRDDVDERVVNDVINKTGGIINDPDEVGGWPTLATPNEDSIPADTDKDGIPDYWENKQGLNPSDSLDGRIITEDGYSNLEHYLNSEIPYISTRSVKLSTIKAINNVELFPNPAMELLSFNSSNQIKKIDIYTINGILAQSEEINTNSSINISNLEKGPYLIKITDSEDNLSIRKLLKY